MEEIAGRLLHVDDRLERLLVSGWRNAGAEPADLAAEADALAALGLAEVADRVRAVATAPSAAEALAAIALASAACRLLRARLPTDTAPAGEWATLATKVVVQDAAAIRLIPVARMALADGEAWACVRLRGVSPAAWLLLEPPESPPTELPALPPTPAAPVPRFAGLMARFGLGSHPAPVDAAAAAPSPWLRRPVRGHLRWLARYPLGAAGEVESGRLEDADWPAPTEAQEDALAPFRQAVAAGKLEDDQPLFSSGGALRVKLLHAREADTYAWVDSGADTAFRATAREGAWAVAWCQDGLVAPLAVVVPGGRFAQPRLIHLVPGCPAEPF